MIVLVDLDDTGAEFTPAFQRELLINPRQGYPQAQMDFFRKLKPIKGFQDAIKQMEAWGLEVWICTRPSTKNPLCYTEKRLWVEDILGYEYAERLILAPDKAMVFGDILIDDTPWPGWVEKFGGKQLQFGSKEFPDWRSVLNFFRRELL